jgi:hypothetical protein
VGAFEIDYKWHWQKPYRMNGLFEPIDWKVWIIFQLIQTHCDKTLGYFERLNVIHIVFNMVIGGVDIVYKKLKLKAHKLDKPRGKSQSSMLVRFHYG